MNTLRRITIVLFAIGLIGFASIAEACPSCKAALASQSGQGDLVSGFFYSILFMMSMPFILLGSFSTYAYVLVRRARQAEAARGHQPAAPGVRTAPARVADHASSRELAGV